MEQTLLNLTKAFIGESQARNRYTYYAKVAKKEGFEQIAAIFLETANHEKEHAKRLFEHIQELKKDNNNIKVDASAPTVYGTTEENLQAAINGEHFETTEMYPGFAEQAEQDNLPKIAARMKSIAIAEKHHEERYKKLLENVKNKTIFKKTQEVEWACRECGYTRTSNEAPKECPSCDHEQSFYQIRCEEY